MAAPIIVTGPPGSGKSHWIQAYAKEKRKQLLTCSCRKDRTLREGRQKLHVWGRRREPTVLWLEGADDLTQEAQAFLRRILETASPNVVCALEVRELWKISAPVLSRCTVVSMKSDYSFRTIQSRQKALSLGILSGTPPNNEIKKITWRDIPALRKAAGDPYEYIDKLCLQGTINTDSIEIIRAIGAGSSPWIQLANYLMRTEST